MKNRKNILVGASVLLIAALMVLSSVVAVANTIDNELVESTATKDTTYIKNPAKFTFKDTTGGSTRGVTCYGCNLHNDPNDNLVRFDSTTPGTFNDIADISSGDFLSGGCFVGDTWYVCEYSADLNSNVWTVDETNGDMQLIGASGVGLSGLAYDPSTDTLYGCDGTDLYTISQVNGDSNPVGPFDTGGLMIGIACDMNGKMYGEDLGTDSLYEINTSTGTATLIGSLGILINYAQDIAYDKINDVLYSTGYKGSTAGGGTFGTLDLNNGQFTIIGDFPIGNMGCPSEVDALAIPYSDVNEPPTTPDISGPTSGEAGVEYCWTFHSYDTNGDEIKYIIEWGDGHMDQTDCFPPCTPIEMCHTYAVEGTYTITAKAKECPDGLESDWGTLTVTMPRNRAYINSPFLNFLESHPNLFPILRYILGL